jgi:ABC-type glycerol-3-phosphate transport system substrate-binding protein
MTMHPSRHRGARRWVSGAAVAASTLALAVAGCGGSSKSNTTSSTSSASSTSLSTSTPTSSGQPLTKAQYEQKLGPLFNNQIDPALKSALSNGGAANPQNLTTAVGLVTEARDAMAAINPPSGIADLHKQAVQYLSALIKDMSKLRDAAQSKNSGDYQTAAKAVTNDAKQIQTVGNKFVAKGY